MNVLLILVPISVLLVAVAIWAFFWAVDNGQFDDLETPALDILRDDVAHEVATTKKDQPL